MPKVLIVGADSQIGSALARHLQADGVGVVGTTRRGDDARPDRLLLDLTLAPNGFDIPDDIDTAVLLAAVTQMAACERDPQTTALINVEHPARLAERLAGRGVQIVTVSTNLVLGDAAPLARADAPYRPGNTYAAQKAALEQRLVALGGKTAILRVTKIAESLGPLLQGWLKALRAGEVIHPFSDLICAPMPQQHLLSALSSIIGQRLSGIFQIGADRDLSYGQIAELLARYHGLDPALVQPRRSSEMGVTVPLLPRHTTLDTAASDSRLGLAPVTSEASLGALFARVTDAIPG